MFLTMNNGRDAHVVPRAQVRGGTNAAGEDLAVVIQRHGQGQTGRSQIKSAQSTAWQNREWMRLRAIILATYHPVGYAVYVVDPTTGEVPDTWFTAVTDEVSRNMRSPGRLSIDAKAKQDFFARTVRNDTEAVQRRKWNAVQRILPTTAEGLAELIQMVFAAAARAEELGLPHNSAQLPAWVRHRLRTPPTFSVAELRTMRLNASNAHRERRVMEIILQATDQLGETQLWTLYPRTYGMLRPPLSAAGLTQIRQDAAARVFIQGAAVPAVPGANWNEGLCLQLSLPCDRPTDNFVANHPGSRLLQEADLQLLKIATDRFDRVPCPQTATEFVIQRWWCMHTYAIDAQEWAAMGGQTAPSIRDELDGWFNRLVPARRPRTIALANARVAEAHTVDMPSGGYQWPQALMWPALDDEARCLRFVEEFAGTAVLR